MTGREPEELWSKADQAVTERELNAMREEGRRESNTRRFFAGGGRIA